MKTLALVLTFTSFIFNLAMGQNLAPNPSFETGIGQPDGWELRYGPGRYEDFGYTGGRSVSVTGTGDCGATWMTTSPVQVEPGGVYALRYKGAVTTWGGGGISCDFEGLGSRSALLSEAWGTYSFYCVIPTNNSPRRIRIGHCGVNGTVYFDDLEVRQCTPFYSKAGGLALGKGESIQTNSYIFNLRMKEQLGSHARSLYQHNAVFRGNEWTGKWGWVLTGSSFVTYRHSLEGLSFTNAKVKLGVFDNYGGELVLHVSRDGDSWQELLRMTPSSGVAIETNLPPEMLTDASVFVRFSTTGSMSVDSYVFQGSVDADLPTADGGTWFFEREITTDIASPSSMSDTSSGHVFTVSLVNTSGAPRSFLATARTVGPEATRENQEMLVVPASSTLEAPLALPSCGPGANSSRVTIQDVDSSEVVMDGFIALNVSPIQDDCYGFQLAQNGGADLWWCNATYKVGRDRALPPATNYVVSLAAARNEYEPFQIVVRPKENFTNVTVSISDFTNSQIPGVTLSSTNVEISQVEYVSITLATDPSCKTGEFPDPVAPLKGPISLTANLNHPLWLTVYVPKDIPAGAYNAVVTIALGSESIQVPVSLRVFGFTLPDSTHTRSLFGWYYEPKWHDLDTTAQADKVIDLYLKNFARHRVTPNNLHRLFPIVYYSAYVDETMVYAHDFKKFDAAMSKYLDEYNFTCVMPMDVPWWGTAYYGYSDWLWGHYGNIMSPMAEHLRQKGWIEKALLYPFDEPQPTSEAANLVKDGTSHLELEVPGVPRLVTTTISPTYYGYVDLWVPHLHYLDKDLAKKRKAQGEEVWWYVSTAPKAPWPNIFTDYSAVDSRIRPWIAQQYGATGDLYWQSAWWFGLANQIRNPWIEPMSVTPNDGSPWGNGDGMLLYPPVRTLPTQPVVEGPINSLRFELIRESLEDGEYFWLLDKAISMAEQRIGPEHPDVLAARAAKEAAMNLVPSKTTFTRSSQALYEARFQLAEAIERLNDGAPFIVTQPKSKAVEADANVVLRVETLAWPLPSYQWRLNGAPLAGETNATITVGPPQTGTYDVIISNAAGRVVSQTAEVAGYWSETPAILQQPTEVVRPADGKAFFVVTAVSANPITYTWLYNGTPLEGGWATNSSLLLTNLTEAQAGIYSVILSNSSGSVTSTAARLTVLVEPASFGVIWPFSTWKYHDSGQDMGSDWRNRTYDDSSWSSGMSQFGYGEGDESTIICSSSLPGKKPITTYFRRSFELDASLGNSALVGRLLRDDAAVVYFNGVEVFRNNLPEGEIRYDTSALSPLNDSLSESEWLEFSIPGNLAIHGANTIAVEIHQQTGEYPYAFGPAAYWSFDEPSSPWEDAVGTNHFIGTGPAILGFPGKVAGAVTNKNSSSAFLSAANPSNLDFSKPFTIGGWFLYGNGTSTPATCLEKPGEFRLYYAGVGVNRYRFEVNGASVQDQSSGKIDEWRFVVAWFDGTNASLQVNNGSVYSVPATAPARSASGLVSLKLANNAGGFAADEIFVYDRVLAYDERAALYSSGMHVDDLSFDFTMNAKSGQAPVFLSSLEPSVRRHGENASFFLQAASAAPVGYQWNFNGSPLPGATNNLLFLPAVTMAQAGSYSLTASNLGGAVTSVSASLTVLPPPAPIVGRDVGFSENNFLFNIAGESGMVVVIEASTNMIFWEPIKTNAIQNGQLQFSDPDSSTFSKRFYRCRYVESSSSQLLIKPAVVPDDVFGFDISGMPGQVVTVETSADLVTWTPVREATLSSGYYRFTDSKTALVPRRFYRVRAQ